MSRSVVLQGFGYFHGCPTSLIKATQARRQRRECLPGCTHANWGGEVGDEYLDDDRWALAEQPWHMSDSQGQILALTYRQKPPDPFEWLPFRSEAVVMKTCSTTGWGGDDNLDTDLTPAHAATPQPPNHMHLHHDRQREREGGREG